MPRERKNSGKEDQFKAVINRIKRKTNASRKLPSARMRAEVLDIPDQRETINGENDMATEDMDKRVFDKSEEIEASERSPLPAPPGRHGAFYANLMNEVKAAPDRPHSKSEKLVQTRRDSASQTRAVKKAINHGIQQLRDRKRTSASLCKSGHFRLECDWFFSDLTNKRHTWYLQLSDYRDDTKQFTDGRKQHKLCDCEKFVALVKQLSRRIHREMVEEANRLYNLKTYDQKMQDYKAGVGKMELPPLTHVEQQLRSLAVNVLHKITDAEGSSNGGDKRKDEKDEDYKENYGKPDGASRNSRDKALRQRQEARKKAETAALAKKMQDQSNRKKADQTRVEAAARHREEAQIKNNEEYMATEAAAKKIKRSTQGRAVNRAAEEEAKRRSMQKKKKEAESKMTSEELKALRSIRAAAREEVEKLDQAEREEEEQQQQEASASGQIDVEAENDGLDAAALGALNDAPSEPGVATRTKSSESTIKTSVPKDSKPSETPKERKKRPKLRSKWVVDDSDDSDIVQSPKSSKADASPKPKSKPESKIQATTTASSAKAASPMSHGDWLAEKFTSRKPSATVVKKVEKATATLTPLKFDDKAKRNNTSQETNEVKGSVDIASKPETSKAQVKPRIQGSSGVKAEQEKTSDFEEENKTRGKVQAETITVALEVHQQNGLTDHVEVTRTTTVESSAHGKAKTTVEHSNRMAAQHTVDANPQESCDEPRVLHPAVNSPHSFGSAPQSQTTERSSHSSSRGKRKRTSSTSPQPFQRTSDQEKNEPSSPPKKRKITPATSPIGFKMEQDSESSSPTPSGKQTASPKPASQTRTHPPISPGAVSNASSTSSSSSKKRKMTWREEDGEVTISPGATKRTKVVQASDEPVTVGQGGATEGAAAMGSVGGAGDACASDAEGLQVDDDDVDDDAKTDRSFNSLFSDRGYEK